MPTVGGPNQSGTESITRYSVAGPQPLVPDNFAAAQAKTLTDAQIDTYIDPSVTGANRTLAHTLMRLMPPNLRGDFIYMSSSGQLISNNPALLQYATVTRGTMASASLQQSMAASSTHRMDYVSSCSPPDPPNPSGGAYVRQVSICGFTGGWAFVNIPCYSTSLQPGEDGLAYFEVTGVNGASEVEGGVFTPDGSTLDPYLRSSTYGGNGYESLINASNREYCGENVFIAHGLTQSGAFTYTMIGDASQYDPQSVWVNETAITPSDPSWLFGPAPTVGISGPGTDPLGNQTPCEQCSVSQVTALGQTGPDGGPVATPDPDGSYFGVSANGIGNNDINWLQVAFGNWASNCVSGTSLCTLDTSNDPGLYYGGAQNYPSSLYAQSNYGPTGYGPYETYDGIALPVGWNSDGITQRAASGGFAPLPPAPTPTPTRAPTPIPSIKPCTKPPCPQVGMGP
ncbi:MAG TPA: hypothetical protein VMF11_03360 [Candidatus Baltobacteraceae bacterium]|nr:hypothetical protein [Candidatus Baltobacteraceae bacterium]